MPTEATSETFDGRLKSVADAIETTLERLLSPETLPGEVVRPGRLLEAMRYSTLGGGKRLRPFLVVETARLFGVEESMRWWANQNVLHPGAQSTEIPVSRTLRPGTPITHHHQRGLPRVETAPTTRMFVITRPIGLPGSGIRKVACGTQTRSSQPFSMAGWPYHHVG